jgi:hypothetical protein
MKLVSILGLIVAMSACSTHLLKCQGPLRPINKPAVSVRPASNSDTAANEEPHS